MHINFDFLLFRTTTTTEDELSCFSESGIHNKAFILQHMEFRCTCFNCNVFPICFIWARSPPCLMRLFTSRSSRKQVLELLGNRFFLSCTGTTLGWQLFLPSRTDIWNYLRLGREQMLMQTFSTMLDRKNFAPMIVISMSNQAMEATRRNTFIWTLKPYWTK